MNIGLQGLIKMVDNKTYKCDYPVDQNINNISSSMSVSTILPTHMEDDVQSYTIERNHDITKDIWIFGKIQKVIIEIGGKTVFSQGYNNEKMVKIAPFEFGIPLISLIHDDTVLYVIGESKGIEVTGIYLDTNERRFIARNKLEFTDSNGQSVTISDGRWNQEKYIDDYYAKDECVKYIKERSDNGYYCDYPRDPDVNNIIAENVVRKGISNKHTSDTYIYEIRNVDILKELIFETEIEHIIITIGGVPVYYKTINKGESLKVLQPFPFGIPVCSSIYHTIKIYIQSSIGTPIMFTRSLKLSYEDRRYLVQTNLDLFYSSTESLRFIQGMCYKNTITREVMSDVQDLTRSEYELGSRVC